MGHLNINSIRNKFELLSSLIGGKMDNLMISETKLDATFSRNQFIIKDIRRCTDWTEMIKVEEG